MRHFPKNKRRTVLVIGDRLPRGPLSFTSFEKFVSYKDRLNKRSIELKECSFEDFLKGKLPAIDLDSIKVMFFFPFKYWDKNIENRFLGPKIYGDELFGKKFNDFFDRAEKRLKNYYKHKKLTFVNDVESLKLNRDKQKTRTLLNKKGIPTPYQYRVKTFSDLIRLLNEGKKLYLKPRYGAMGKGITYLSPQGWYTNFLFRKGKIVSRRNDFGWRFINITGNKDFLKKLIKRDVVCEDAISVPVVKNKKFDLSIDVIYGKIPYLYARTIPDSGIVTNWSQGGTIEKRWFLRHIPKDRLKVAKFYARKASRAMGLNYAGMDILFSEDYKKVYVLEGHSFPSYETGFNLIKYLIDHI